jgi:hypothetical protein
MTNDAVVIEFPMTIPPIGIIVWGSKVKILKPIKVPNVKRLPIPMAIKANQEELGTCSPRTPAVLPATKSIMIKTINVQMGFSCPNIKFNAYPIAINWMKARIVAIIKSRSRFARRQRDIAIATNTSKIDVPIRTSPCTSMLGNENIIEFLHKQ